MKRKVVSEKPSVTKPHSITNKMHATGNAHPSEELVAVDIRTLDEALSVHVIDVSLPLSSFPKDNIPKVKSTKWGTCPCNIIDYSMHTDLKYTNKIEKDWIAELLQFLCVSDQKLSTTDSSS